MVKFGLPGSEFCVLLPQDDCAEGTASCSILHKLSSRGQTTLVIAVTNRHSRWTHCSELSGNVLPVDFVKCLKVW